MNIKHIRENFILDTLKANDNNRKLTSIACGISERTLYRFLEKQKLTEKPKVNFKKTTIHDKIKPQVIYPKYTILYNIDGDFVGTGYEFFITVEKATKRYNQLCLDVNYSPTLRPYNHSVDKHFLGAVHTNLKYN